MYQRPLFRDRVDAGRILAQSLVDECAADAVVVGLARGGIEVAAEVARVLGLPLDAVAVRKIRHPVQPEYALGAVTPAGGVYLRSADGLTDDEIAAAIALARDEAEQLDRRLHAERVPLDLAGRQAIVVDDGLATAATMIAAVRWAGGRGAAQVVAAAPVASTEGVALLRNEADRVVCPYKLAGFGAVGFWYHDFGQVDDEKAIRLLEQGSTGADGHGL
jgi:predicted phosphoribosyltransferase